LWSTLILCHFLFYARVRLVWGSEREGGGHTKSTIACSCVSCVFLRVPARHAAPVLRLRSCCNAVKYGAACCMTPSPFSPLSPSPLLPFSPLPFSPSPLYSFSPSPLLPSLFLVLSLLLYFPFPFYSLFPFLLILLFTQ